ncbi:MAG: hypothetical protein ACJ74W_17085 [Pyrinomonadaceae bacterium]
MVVFVPSFPFLGELTAAERALKIVLALPVGYVVVEAVLVQYEELPADRPRVGYLIAAQVIDMIPVLGVR